MSIHMYVHESPPPASSWLLRGRIMLLGDLLWLAQTTKRLIQAGLGLPEAGLGLTEAGYGYPKADSSHFKDRRIEG